MSSSATEPQSSSEPSSSGPEGILEFYALVAYLPEPVATFLSELRHDLDPKFRGRPHLTILPPRPLLESSVRAWEEIRGRMASSHPIGVSLGEVQTFPDSYVVYVGLTSGGTDVTALHESLNQGRVKYCETWSFCPHVTVAHGVCAETLRAASVDARAKWEAYKGPRELLVTRLDWVRTCVHTDPRNFEQRGLVKSDSEWEDLDHWDLGAPLR